MTKEQFKEYKELIRETLNFYGSTLTATKQFEDDHGIKVTERERFTAMGF